MEFIENNKYYKFLPSHKTTIDNIKIQEKIFENDIFEKYKCNLQIQGEIIICNQANIIAINNNKYKIIKETYEEYQKNILFINPEKDKWIYNIIDGLDEQESILYKDHLCIIIPSYTWITQNIEQLHILCLPLDKTLRCLRSLEGKHIELLQYIKTQTIKIIKEHYDIDETEHKIFDSSIEYCHALDNIIYNLSIKNDYYQKIILNKRVF
jgi:hypothetical protein